MLSLTAQQNLFLMTSMHCAWFERGYLRSATRLLVTGYQHSTLCLKIASTELLMGGATLAVLNAKLTLAAAVLGIHT